MKPITNIDDPRYVRALSHPLRVRILAMLQERTASPSQLSEWLGATLGTTAYHVRSLHQLGLIELADEYARKSAAEGGFDRAEAHLSRTSIKLDAKGWEQLNAACLKFVEQVEKIDAAGRKRQEKHPHQDEVGDAAVVLMAFEAERLSGKEPERQAKRRARRPPRATTA